MEQLVGETAVITRTASGTGRDFADRVVDACTNVVLADLEDVRP